MKTWTQTLISRHLPPGIACLAALLLYTPASRAGLTFQLYLYRSGQSYQFYTPLSTNATAPNAAMGMYTINSPQWPTNGSTRQFELATNGLNLTFGQEHPAYHDFDTVMQQITNGTWTILFTNATTTNLYTFTVSAPDMNSNMLPVTIITFPSDGVVNVANQPTFTWQGPANWPVSGNAYVYNHDFSFFQSASLQATQDNWTIPASIPDSTGCTFRLQYVTNSATPLFIATTPLSTNSSHDAISGWVSTSAIETGDSVSFETTNHPVLSGTGHILLAHYALDDSGNLGQDNSGNGNDMNGESWWGSPTHQFDTDVAAGGGAVQFFGTSSMTPPDSTRSNWNLTLAGSFTMSAWVKTTTSRGNDNDNAVSGAAIFWAYNDQYGTNDTIPLAITGSKAAFTTRDHLGNSTTLHSTTSVNDGNYHLITVTRNQATGQKIVYVDGNFETSEPGTTEPLNGNDYYLSVGGTVLSSYSGLLDDVQIYFGVLSAAEVATLNSNPGTTIPDLTGNGTNGIVAHYDFDENAVLAADVSGNGNDVVHAGSFGGSGPSISIDTIAGAGSVSFDGGSYLTASSNLLSTIASDFSISVWVKTTQSVGSPGDMAYWGAAIVSADIPTGGAGDAIPIALTAGQVAFNTGDGSSDQTLNSSTTVNDHAWHHLVVTRNQATGEKQIYIDGALDSSEIGTTVLLNGPQLLTLGAKSDANDPDPASPDSNGSQGYEGLLDDVQIYSRVLSSDEVAYLYANPGSTVSNSAYTPYPVDVDLQFYFIRSQDPNFGEYFSASVSFNSVNPAPTTTNKVQSSSGYFWSEQHPSGGNGSSVILSSLGAVLNEFTNGLWTLYINQGSPTQQVYSFRVSVSDLDTNLLKAVKVFLPTNGAINIATNPEYYWNGPSNFTTLQVDLLSGPVASLPIASTNWPSAPTLNYGPDRFDVAYTSNGFPGVTFTTPVDASSNAVRTWTTTVNLSSAAFNNFVVGAPGPAPVQLVNPQRTSGNVQFSFTTLAGRTNAIEARTNLVLGSWIELTNFVGDGSLRQFTFPTANPPIRFFRVRTQ